jgi:multidrug efflux pump subunit AcrB
VRANASESSGSVVVDVNLGADPERVLNDIKSAVDRVTSFPKDVERPVVSMPQLRRQVIQLVVYGDQSEKALREQAERIRDELLEDEDITVVDLDGVRPLEVSIEVPQEELRRYGLSLDAIAAKARPMVARCWCAWPSVATSARILPRSSC